MHVISFASAVRADLEAGGGVSASGFPMTRLTVGAVPATVSIPIVLATWTSGGTDHDPCRYIVATSPDGQRVGTVECSWHWPDTPGSPVKFWVLTRQLTIVVRSAGVYTIGLYDSLGDAEPEQVFPLPVFVANPLMRSTSIAG